MTDPALVRIPATDDRVNAAFARVLADLTSPESVRAYREEWSRWCQHLAALGTGGPLAARTQDVQMYLLGQRANGKRASTRARALAVLRSIYGALAREDVLPGVNPAREAKNPKGDVGPPRTPWLGEAELTAFLAADPGVGFIPERDYLIALTLAMTGLRRAEVARIAAEDLAAPDPTTGDRHLRVRVKGGKHGVVKLAAPIAGAITAWCAAQGITAGPVFPRAPGRPEGVGVGTVRNAVKRQAALAGFADDARFTPHAFRRTLATIADQRGVPKEVIQRTLLHAKVATTERYMKLGHAPQTAADGLVDLIPARLRGR